MKRRQHGSALAGLAVLAAFTVAWVSCSSSSRDIAREVMERADEPVGMSASALDNPMHAVHVDRAAPVACDACHDIDAEEFAVPERDKCVECHVRNEKSVHGDELPCIDCHVFGADQQRPAENCIECHEEPQGELAALVVHTERDCRSCHSPHGEPAVVAMDCLECHEDHELRHGTEPATIRCGKCHKPHEKATAALDRCSECHDRKKMRGATFRGHAKCDTCHINEVDVRRDCVDCHRNRPGKALAAVNVKEHDDCTNCHSPHDPRGTARLSCVRCHDDVATSHPADKKLGSCLGCHEAHPTRAAPASPACTTCHKKTARVDTGIHSKELTCRSCHEQHEFDSPSCGSCHEDEVRSSAIAGHTDCSSCHDSAHSPKRSMPTCGDCHITEHTTAPTGHQDCAKCHDEHSGKRLAKTACSSCHESEAKSVHATVDGGCETCHRAHGPGGTAKPQSCVSCHPQPKLPAMHVIEEHDTCETCHMSHGTRLIDRDTCLSECHEEVADHEPGATTCVGCHQFRGDR